MKYEVIDTNRPAVLKTVLGMTQGWDNNIFDTLEEAQKYANNWLGDIYAPKHLLRLNEKYMYYQDGLGEEEIKCWLQIREVK